MYSDNHNGVVKTQQATFQRERAHDLWGEIEPLLAEHYHELATHQDISLAPDKEKYNAAEDAGSLRCYTVRVGGKLVGYGVFVVAPNPHYSASKQAVQDVVFLAAAHRRGRLGLMLVEYADTELAAEDVDLNRHHVKVKHPALRRVLEYLGYELEEWVMVKRLNKGH